MLGSRPPAAFRALAYLVSAMLFIGVQIAVAHAPL
ncbi:hypothetical protein DSM104635_02700 [Terricaulis silvestris]|uniref:Uncharacterized protein n=1 Tax=Terricaulis silvestris TaxID=2686094 RepID=A0A6I6MST7_9CAUL|nr:hypothetical protein DSM104635_02700 [Terricaulis silvestris]